MPSVDAIVYWISAIAALLTILDYIPRYLGSFLGFQRGDDTTEATRQTSYSSFQEPKIIEIHSSDKRKRNFGMLLGFVGIAIVIPAIIVLRDALVIMGFIIAALGLINWTLSLNELALIVYLNGRKYTLEVRPSVFLLWEEVIYQNRKVFRERNASGGEYTFSPDEEDARYHITIKKSGLLGYQITITRNGGQIADKRIS